MKSPFVVGALLAVTTARADSFDWAGKVELDAEGLTSDDPKQRLDAVHRLAMDSILISQPFLLKALSDEDRSVRLEAARTLGMRGSRAPGCAALPPRECGDGSLTPALTGCAALPPRECGDGSLTPALTGCAALPPRECGDGSLTAAVPVLVDWLADTDPRTRATAADALGEIGGPFAAHALTRSLGDSDPAVRQSAVKSLGKEALRGSPGVVAALLPRLTDDKSQVRRETVEQLEQIGDRRAVIALVSRFSDTSKEVARAAVRAVGVLGDRAAVPALIRTMSDADENLRRLAAQSLGQLAAADATEALIGQLGSASTEAFRSSVAHALGKIAAAPGTGSASDTAMRVLVNDLVSSSTRIAVREALRGAGYAAVPALVARLTARTKGDVSPIITLLGEIGDARATAALTAELERGRVAPGVVLQALGNTRDPQALLPVLSATSSADASIRLAAMEALRPLLHNDARAGDVLVERLDDDNLEIRILAAEYLGALRVASPKLAVIAASNAPLRLRVAAIGALGEVAATGKLSEAPKVLVDILRLGPRELHAAASAALSQSSDPAALTALISVARTTRGPTRYEVVRAIGGLLRRNRDAAGRGFLRALVNDGDIKVATAAVCGLAAASDPRDTAVLRAAFEHGTPELRRAAAWALGEVRDISATELLIGALSSPDDRLAAAAAWALGEIAITAPSRSALTSLTDRWLHLARFGGWAAAINGTGALGRTLWAHPPDARKPSPTQRDALVGLTVHKSRLVRINAAFALSSLAGDADAERALTKQLRDDTSPHVRAAAAVGLGRMGSGRAALEARIRTDSDVAVVAAAKEAINGPSTPPVRDEWRTFLMVDDHRSPQDRNQPYFVHGPDGLVWASYTDARGELTSEHVPAGTSALHVWPADRESSY